MIVKADTYPMEVRVKMREGKGEAHIFPLVADGLPTHCRMWNRIELPVGASIGFHAHEKETELFYFISGSGEVLDNDARSPIHAGDSLATGNGGGHSVINTGTETLVFLACIVTEA